MDGISELAKMLKERENKLYSGPMVGQVLNPLPDIKVKLGDSIILTAEDLVVSGHIYEHYHQSDPERYLNSGDEVILVPTGDFQIFYLIDKAVRP